MQGNNEFLRAIEELNREIIDIYESKEYAEGKKILHWMDLIKKHKILESIPNFFMNKKVLSNYEKGASENFDFEEWNKYLHFGDPNLNIVVYTCITGNYDKPKQPLLKFGNVKYILFTDDTECLKKDNSIWEYRKIPDIISDYNNIYKNRYIKMHPFDLFGDSFDVSIYIDGNVKVISDISIFAEMINDNVGIAAHKHRFRDCIYEEESTCELKRKGNIEKMREQIEFYRNEEFPAHYGLIECTVLATQLHNKTANIIYQQWWNEFLHHDSMRDQLSLPYILWKNNIDIKQVCTLGRNLYRNKKIRVYSH